jgi:diguanylate cyclase
MDVDEQLDLAPFGYLVIDRANRIVGMNQAMREMAGADRLTVSITVSIGVAAFVRGDNADTLFDRADKALYEAKSAGRNRVAAG